MRLLIRADADENMGTGHVMRCLALGQAWRDAGGEVVFATACTSALLMARLRHEGFSVRPPEGVGFPPAVDDHGAWLALDGYHFESEYQQRARQTGYRLLVIDDMAHLPHYYADAVLNQNTCAERYSYSREPYTRLLLGPSYALLRREFTRWRNWHREIPDIARKVLVTLGGSDPENVTAKAVEGLASLASGGFEIVVVAGGHSRAAPQLARLVAQAGMKFEHNVGDMAPVMAWADLAVSGAGSTCWELAFMGLPAILVVLADNQCGIAESLSEHCCAVSLGRSGDIRAEHVAGAVRRLAHRQHERAAMSANAARLVDGAGAERVIAALQSC
jgi:UDP-2,4-diacetamido-2,4,6-trideoxy-beta-L-altropyranose hydrolase